MGLGELFRWLGCVRFLALLIFCSRGDCSCSHVLSSTRPPARLSLILTPSELVLESCWARDVHGGNVLSGLSWKTVVAHHWSLTTSLPCCEEGCAGSSCLYRTPHVQAPSTPSLPYPPQRLPTLSPKGTEAAGAVGGTKHLPLFEVGFWGRIVVSLFPCRGPGGMFGSLLLSPCFSYASFLFKCHRSLHQLISLYMDGI